MNFDQSFTSPNQFVHFSFFGNVKVFIKREDLLHEFISGNKLRKLKYNLLKATSEKQHTLLTFGGAYSNHIAAASYAAKIAGLKSIGVIRGDELEDKVAENPTLRFAQENGMTFYFISRESYRERHSEAFVENLKKTFGDFYLVPEGGTNLLAIKGCEEILTPEDQNFDYICSAVGTGGTISGIINSSFDHQTILGFSALKGNFLEHEIRKYTSKTNWKLISDYHFGGYAKTNNELIAFINEFYNQSNIPLDPVYTGKMCFGITDMIRKGIIRNGSRILLIHTGGLQGISGMNQKLETKKLPKIHV